MGDQQTTFDLLSKARFVIGADDQLAGLRSKHPAEPAEEDGKKRLTEDWERLLSDIHIRTGTLLKTDAVSFLLGAGASAECGGPLISTIPLLLERELLRSGITGEGEPGISPWIEAFYVAAAIAGGESVQAPLTREDIRQRRASLSGEPQLLQVNLEAVLSLLHRWRRALPETGGRIELHTAPAVDLRAEAIDQCAQQVTSALLKLCALPTKGAEEPCLQTYKNLLRKMLTRPLSLKRGNIFTLNYDTLVEQAADAEGVILIDGFVGTMRRAFRPESFDHDLYFPAETTEGRVHRLERVLHLYKLHGSITWTAEEVSWDNPYGVRAHEEVSTGASPVLIYPTPAKWGDALGMPYAELLRRFATAVVRPQSVLFVVGYAFGDEHIRAIVHQALAIPSFTLVIVDPKPESEFVSVLRKRGERRVWILSGETFGTFTGFVRHALGDLGDESMRREVMGTYRALADVVAAAPTGGAVNA